MKKPSLKGFCSMEQLLRNAGMTPSQEVVWAMTELVLAADSYGGFSTEAPVVVRTTIKEKVVDSKVKVVKSTWFSSDFEDMLKAFEDLPGGIEALAKAINSIPVPLSRLFGKAGPEDDFWEMRHAFPVERTYGRYAKAIHDGLMEVYYHYRIEPDWARHEETLDMAQEDDLLYDPGAFHALQVIAAFHAATRKSKRR